MIEQKEPTTTTQHGTLVKVSGEFYALVESQRFPLQRKKATFSYKKKHRIFLSIRTIRCFLITVCRFCFLTLCNLGIDFYNTGSLTAFCSYSSSLRLRTPDAFTAPNPNAMNIAAPTHRSQFVMELFPV